MSRVAEKLTDDQILAQAQAELAAEDAVGSSVSVAAPPEFDAVAQADTSAAHDAVIEAQQQVAHERSLRELLNPEWKDRKDEEVAAELANAFTSAQQIHQQNQQLQQYLAQQRAELAQYEQHKADFEKYRASQQAAAQQPEPKAKFWEPAPYDETWEAYRDPNSPTGFREGTPAEVVVGWNRYVGNQREFFNDLRTNWDERVGGWVDQRAKTLAEQVIEDRVSSKLAEFQARLDSQQFVQQNADWLTERDPLTGQFNLSPAGRQLHGYMSHLQSIGVQDPATLRAVASKLMIADIYAAQQQRQQAAMPPQAAPNGYDANQEHKNRLVAAGAMRTPNRGGTIPTSMDAAPQNSKLSLRQMIEQELAAQGN